ncbi:uncharacterized protein DUF4231 [Mycoplasma testudineum]|uniref:Uncharacterized protein DUF4231 n=1 Tax=Mycoplasma testudineum TaxID=244584 RepID=A0A4R6IBW4_9MOLU|nr:DUF4231 domain-containing protein [Mycoplasma testudineum]OYD26590.1 hypothetical protein CG473_03060 [Mycoplasma testudineum]TDO19422.1 uncharacterized protein DUF4231 [Mycoplasma testudineum]
MRINRKEKRDLENGIKISSTLKNDAKRLEAYKKVKLESILYERKEKKSEKIFLTLRFSIIIINFSLLILSLLQIRYNIFPVDTIVFYISISIILAVNTFLTSVSAIAGFKNRVEAYRSEIPLLELTLEKAKGVETAQDILDIHTSLTSENEVKK